jgi:curved DNA-binding protein CbpA
MKNRRNLYRLLQVQPDAPIEIIRMSYRTLMRELKQHPDLGGDHEKASILNEAYEILSDPGRRTEYDKELFQRYTKKIPLKQQAVPEQSINQSAPETSTVHQPEKDAQQAHRRKVNRMKRHEKVRYYSASHHLDGTAEMLDVSTDGVRFICSQKLNVKLNLRLMSSLFRAEAQVISSQKCIVHGKTNYCIGAQFTSITFNKPRGSFVSNTA